MKCVMIESPFSGDIERNNFYARLCTLDAIKRGEAPMTPHLVWPSLTKDVQGMVRPGFIHDDSDNSPLSRAQAFERIEALRAKFDFTVFYTDLGYSNGMTIAKNNCIIKGFPYEERALPGFAALMKEYDDQRVLVKAGLIAAACELTSSTLDDSTLDGEEHMKTLTAASQILAERKRTAELAELNRMHKETINSYDLMRSQNWYFELRNALERGDTKAAERVIESLSPKVETQQNEASEGLIDRSRR